MEDYNEKKLSAEIRKKREDWINNECEFVTWGCCQACPYVVYDKFGRSKCDPIMKHGCLE